MTDPSKLELEVEVPGSPEQVWEAIATGPGISAWFASTRIDGREIAFDMGGGITSAGEVTAFEPPHRFVYEEPLDEEGARIASEWLVEARSGGTCVVRLVSSLFGSSGDWEDELGGLSDGWKAYMQNLRLYLTHFAGQPSAGVNEAGGGTGTLDEGWAKLAGELGLTEAQVGDEVSTAPAAPRVAGVVERRTGGSHHRELLLRVSEPAPGTAFVLVYRYQDRMYVGFRAYLFGADAPAVAERERARWRAWLDERFAEVPA
jgi:uncharacterized protein YndB with AHSA1/START domain